MSSSESRAVRQSLIVQRAESKFVESLSPKQRSDFSHSTLEDVYQTILDIQKKHGSSKELRNMARMEGFLHAMNQLGEMVDRFLNSTPFMGYVWVCFTFENSADLINEISIGTN